MGRRDPLPRDLVPLRERAQARGGSRAELRLQIANQTGQRLRVELLHGASSQKSANAA